MIHREYNLKTGEVIEYEVGDTVYVTPVVTDIILRINARQIRRALTHVGLRSAVEAAVAAGDQDLKDWWEFTTAFDRYHPEVLVMADKLGVTASALDNLWRLGSTL